MDTPAGQGRTLPGAKPRRNVGNKTLTAGSAFEVRPPKSSAARDSDPTTSGEGAGPAPKPRGDLTPDDSAPDLQSFPRPTENEAHENVRTDHAPESGVKPAGLAARVDAALEAEDEGRRSTAKSIPAAAPLEDESNPSEDAAAALADSGDTEIATDAPPSQELPTDPKRASPVVEEAVTDPLAEPPPPREGSATQTAAAAYANTEVAIVAPPAMQAVTQLQGTPFPDDPTEAAVDPDGTEPTLDSPAALAGEPTRPLVQLPEGRAGRLEDAQTPPGTAAPPILPATPTRASHPGEAPARVTLPPPAVRVVASGVMKAFLAGSFCLGAAGLSFFGWALYVTRGRAAVPEAPVGTPVAPATAASSSEAPSTIVAPEAPAPAEAATEVEPGLEEPTGDEGDGEADGEHAPAAGERAEIQPFELSIPRLSRRARRMNVRQRRRQSSRLKASAMRAYREENFEEAERLYREAMTFNNWDVGAVEGLARSTARQSRFDEAVAWAQLAVSRASRSPIAYRVLGDVWRQAGHPEEARSAYERGIARSPNDRWLRQRLRDIGAE
ncbi:MAG: hypothetical protein AB8I08_37670 [Sandaracinaceae bacterium]